jgi:hypothetical protein
MGRCARRAGANPRRRAASAGAPSTRARLVPSGSRTGRVGIARTAHHALVRGDCTRGQIEDGKVAHRQVAGKTGFTLGD